MQKCKNIENITNVKENLSFWHFRTITIFAAIFTFLSFFIFLIIIRANYPTNSELVIRAAAAESLNKDPNQLNKRDYAKVTRLDLSGKELSDISFLRKFKNLEYLKLEDLVITHKETPKWKMVLQKFHIIKQKPLPIPKPTTKPIIIVSTGDATGFQQMMQQRQTLENIYRGDVIDLRPLKKLKKLQMLQLGNKTRPMDGIFPLSEMYSGLIPFINIESLSSLKNLKQLSLNNTLISDIEPLKCFKNLQHLFLSETDVNDLGPLKDLTNLKLFL